MDDDARDDQHEYAERMFPEPVDLGIAEADRAVSSVTPRHPELPRGRGRRAGQQLVPRRRRGQGQGRAGHHHLPADPRPADPGRPVRAGEDRDPHRHGSQPAAGRLDRSHHPGHRGRAERGRLGPQPGAAGDRRRPGPAPRELPQGHRRLPLAGRAGLRGRARPDDLGQLAGAAGHGQRARGGLHRLDRRPQVRLRVLLHRGQRRHPHRGHHVRPVAQGPGPRAGRPVLGGGLVGQGLRRLLPRHGHLAWA